MILVEILLTAWHFSFLLLCINAWKTLAQLAKTSR